jgi:hypothetical protein
MPDLPSQHRDRISAALGPLGLQAEGLRFLAQGANNVVYAFEAGGRALVAKIGVNPGSRCLGQEWAFLKAHAGIGPQALGFAVDGQGSQLVIQERLIGEHPFLLDAVGLEALGRAVRSYHGLAAPSGTPKDDWGSFMACRILPTPPGTRHPSLAADLASAVAAALAWGAALGPVAAPPVLVHGDLIPLNLIQQGPQRFRIIDWEGLRVDEAEADVVTLFKAYRCGPADQAAFMRGYGPGLDPQRLRFRRLLHDLQVAAWRLACQLPAAQGAALEKALSEAEEELAWVGAALKGA